MKVMKKGTTNEKGFSIVAFLIIILIIAVLGIALYATMKFIHAEKITSADPAHSFVVPHL
jgi:competence protein ComGC